MKYKNVFWGVILVILGILFILKNLSLIYFSWGDIWSLWPVLLILWGISILPIKSGVKLLLSLVAVVIAVWVVAERNGGWENRINWHREYEDEYSEEWKGKKWSDQQVAEPWNPDIDRVYLVFEAAAGTFEINGTTDELFEFSHEGNLGPYEMKVSGLDRERKIKLELAETSIGVGRVKNYAEMLLNTNPSWNIDIHAGAARIKLDLSPFKVEDLDIDGGASSLDVRLGDLSADVTVNIDAGVSSLTLRIPEEVGCEIETDSFLTSRNFKGFDKIESGRYQTGNFKESDKRIYINIDTAISSIKIIRD